MLEIIKYLFTNFWTWLGGLIYLLIIAAALTQIRLIEINPKNRH